MKTLNGQIKKRKSNPSSKLSYGGRRNVEANPMYDTKSEKAQELLDKAEKILEDYLRNPNIMDVRDLLDTIMDNDKLLVDLLQGIFTKDDLLTGRKIREAMRDMFWELAQRDAEREMEK